MIDHPAMLAKFESYKDKSRLDYDLNFLYGLRERVSLTRKRSPEILYFRGDKLIIPLLISADILNTVDINTLEVTATDMNQVVRKRRRTRARNILTMRIIVIKAGRVVMVKPSGDARTDGMNWDLMNDGVGNGRNCKSMLYSHVTPQHDLGCS